MYNIYFTCGHKHEDYLNCEIQILPNGVFHYVKFKYPKKRKSFAIENLKYEYNQINEISSIYEPLDGIPLTNIANLTNQSTDAIINLIINAIFDFFSNLIMNGLYYEKKGNDFGKHFCKYVAFIVSVDDRFTVNFLEKYDLQKCKPNKKYAEKMGKTMQSILTAFLFERLLKNESAIACSAGCKFKRFKTKFPQYTYDNIHAMICINNFNQFVFPELIKYKSAIDSIQN